MAVDFESELMQWTDGQYYTTHVHKIQLPFSQVRYLSPVRLAVHHLLAVKTQAAQNIFVWVFRTQHIVTNF